MVCCGVYCWGIAAAVVGVVFLLVKMIPSMFAPKYPAIKSGTVVITGASTGIGADAAITLSKKGFRVFAGVRKDADGKRLLEQAGAGANLVPLIIDVTKPDTVTAAVKTVEREVGSGGIVGLVNNAGVNTQGPMEFQDLEEIQRQVDVNLFGQIRVTQAFLPLIRKAKGRIVNISSVSGLLTSPFQGAYCISKRALEAFNDALRRELRPWKISVSVLNPGFLATEILNKARSRNEELQKDLPEGVAKYYKPHYENHRPLSKRLIGPVSMSTDAIHHALTSTSPKARYIVGTKDFHNMITGWWWLPDYVLDYFLAQKMWPKKAKVFDE